MPEGKTLDRLNQTRAKNNISLKTNQLNHTQLDALRVLAAQSPNKQALRQSLNLLFATVLAKAPYARNRDIRDALVMAIWEMASKGELPEHTEFMTKNLYLARCAARMTWKMKTRRTSISSGPNDPTSQK